MSTRSDSNRPPIQEGLDQGNRKDPQAPGTGIVPFGQDQRRAHEVPAYQGYLSCVLGGIVSGLAPVIGCGVAGYGMYIVARDKNVRSRLAGIACVLVAALALSLTVRYASPIETLACCGVGIATALLVADKRLTTGAGCALVALTTLALMASDAVAAARSGTNLATLATALFGVYQQSLGSDLSATALAQLQLLKGLYETFWPLSYVMSAAGVFLLAWVGVRGVARLLGTPADQLPRFANYDVPLWVVVAGIAALLALTVGQRAQIAPLTQVSSNVIMTLRFAFALQGFAVLAWLVGGRKVSPLTGFLLAVCALYLEIQFIVMTLVGFVDVWKNFRHLPRGRKVTVQDHANQE